MTREGSTGPLRRRDPLRVNLWGLVAQITGMALVFALALFLPAGTTAWPVGWVFLMLFMAFAVTLTVWLHRFNPDLLAERMGGIGRPDQKAWDKVLLAITALAFFGWLAVMALDAARLRWSAMPPWLQALGEAVLLSSFYLFYLTFRANAYLSPTVRIQTDRAHQVVSTGPYRYVRHPMYTAFVVLTFGTALLLGSWWGMLGGLVLIGLVSRRAVLEERALREELPGYESYMTRVRYRLVPRVW